MKVFLCWSGGLSKAIAAELNGWLPDVVQSIEPFFSEDNIDAGTPWFQKIEEELKETYFGVLCITRSNRHSHWIHYEAGGLRKGIGKNCVVPLLIDLEPSELEQPLAAFQNVACDKEGINKLLDSLNENAGKDKLEVDRLQRYFDKNWQAFADAIEKHKGEFEAEENAEPIRTDADKIDEVLALTRQIHKKQLPSAQFVPPGAALAAGLGPGVLDQFRRNALADYLLARPQVTRPGLLTSAIALAGEAAEDGKIDVEIVEQDDSE